MTEENRLALLGLGLSEAQQGELWQLVRRWSQFYPGVNAIPLKELLEGLGLISLGPEGRVLFNWELRQCLMGTDGRGLGQWLSSWDRLRVVVHTWELFMYQEGIKRSVNDSVAGMEVTCTLWCTLGVDFILNFDAGIPRLTDKSWERFKNTPSNPTLENVLTMFGGPKPWAKERVLKWRKRQETLRSMEDHAKSLYAVSD